MVRYYMLGVWYRLFFGILDLVAFDFRFSVYILGGNFTEMKHFRWYG